MPYALYKKDIILGVGLTIDDTIDDALLYHSKNGMLTDSIMSEKINLGVATSTYIGTDPKAIMEHPRLNLSPCTDMLFKSVIDGDNTHFRQCANGVLYYSYSSHK
jgi:hypothetical protein